MSEEEILALPCSYAMKLVLARLEAGHRKTEALITSLASTGQSGLADKLRPIAGFYLRGAQAALLPLVGKADE